MVLPKSYLSISGFSKAGLLLTNMTMTSKNKFLLMTIHVVLSQNRLAKKVFGKFRCTKYQMLFTSYTYQTMRSFYWRFLLIFPTVKNCWYTLFNQILPFWTIFIWMLILLIQAILLVWIKPYMISTKSSTTTSFYLNILG